MTQKKRTPSAARGLATTASQPKLQRLVDELSAVLTLTPGATCTRLDGVVPRVLERCQTCTVRIIASGTRPSGTRPLSFARWARWLVRVEGRAVHASLQCDMHVRPALDAALASRVHAERQLVLFDDAGDIARARKSVRS